MILEKSTFCESEVYFDPSDLFCDPQVGTDLRLGTTGL